MAEARTITDAVTQAAYRVTLGGETYAVKPPVIARNLQLRQQCRRVIVPGAKIILDARDEGKDMDGHEMILEMVPFLMEDGIDIGLAIIVAGEGIPEGALDKADDEELVAAAFVGVRMVFPFLRSLLKGALAMMGDTAMLSPQTSQMPSKSTTKRNRGGRKASTK
jgi:hypothetical protein